MKRLGMAYKPDGAESMDDGFRRILGFANGLPEPGYTPEHPQHVVAFTHSNIIGCMIAAVAGRKRHYTDVIPVDQGSMSLFAMTGNTWDTIAQNVGTQANNSQFALPQ